MEADSQRRRSVGSDNPYVDWVPIVSRASLRWPHGANLAVGVVVSVEHLELHPPAEAWPTPSAVGYGPYPAAFQISRVADAEYGGRVGAFRLLEALDRNGIRPMAAIDAALLADHGRLVREFAARNAEFLGHGIALSRSIGEYLDADVEREYLRTSLDLVEGATGHRPVGWLGAEYGESTRTVEMLAELGVGYVCDWANDEQPYPMRVRQGPMTALPVAVDLDDLLSQKVRRLPPWRWSKLVISALRQLVIDGSKQGRLLILNLHAHVSGQPYRIKYVEEVFAAIADTPEVWLATGSEVNTWVRDAWAAGR